MFPLWLGDVPALLKAFFEQALRPGFAIGKAAPGRLWKKLLKGRSARVIVTMGMPAFFYRLYYRAHGVKSLKRNILEFCGISPVRASLIGTVESEGARELLARQGAGARPRRPLGAGGARAHRRACASSAPAERRCASPGTATAGWRRP